MSDSSLSQPLWDSVRSELQRMLAEEPQIFSSREGVMLLVEQLFDLWSATRTTRTSIRSEALVLAALALRFLIDLNTMQG